MPALTAYEKLLQELLAAREAAGGELSQEAESEFVCQLDMEWLRLTPKEQDAIEVRHRRHCEPKDNF